MVREPQTVFGESPTPDPRPKAGWRAEGAGIIRGLMLVTGAFIILAILIILIGQLPLVPEVARFGGQGEWEVVAAEEEAVLSSYGWVDQENGVVRIPIREAIDLQIEQGLPSRQVETPDEDEEGQAGDAEAPAEEGDAEAPAEEGDAEAPAEEGDAEAPAEETPEGQ